MLSAPLAILGQIYGRVLKSTGSWSARTKHGQKWRWAGEETAGEPAERAAGHLVVGVGWLL